MQAIKKSFQPNMGAHQKGATLAIALIFLVLITLLTVTALSTTTLEEKMAGNFKDINLATQAAHAALRDAKYDIQQVVFPGKIATAIAPRTPSISGESGFGDASETPGTCSTSGLCLPLAGKVVPNTPINASWILSQDFTGPPSVSYGTYTLFPPLTGVAIQPHYLIEIVKVAVGGAGGPVSMYRITAVGYGANANTKVVLQEVFTPPFYN